MFNTLYILFFCVAMRCTHLHVAFRTNNFLPKLKPKPMISMKHASKKYVFIKQQPDSFLCKSSFQCKNYCCAIFYKTNHPLSTGYCCKNGRLAIENFYTMD